MHRADRATTSATGTSIAEIAWPRASLARGFTLIEILVVVVIIAMISVGAILAIGTTGQDRELDRESTRLLDLMKYAREQAELQTREFGLRCAPGSYEFVTFDGRKGIWRRVDEDEALRERTLPEGLSVGLVIEGREVVLRRDTKIEDLTPQVMVFSNGDLTSFELSLVREGGGSRRITSDESGRILSDAELQAEKDAKGSPEKRG
jgi:general secretion pathway protein H